MKLKRRYYKTESGKLYRDDSLKRMAKLPDNSIDAVVTDPPYGISFMNSKWDYDVPSVELWREVHRVLKPGGYLLSFAGTRTYHRMACGIEDAGFEIRDMCAWVYGSGFPKSLNIGKAVDELRGNKRRVIGTNISGKTALWHEKADMGKHDITKGNSEWEGWGTNLKPSMEPIVIARKPLSEKTVVENVLKWKTGGINVDGCRVKFKNESDKRVGTKDSQKGASGNPFSSGNNDGSISTYKNNGRFPANLIHDGSDEVLELFPNNAARFFYTAKASKSERNMGCDELEKRSNMRVNAPRQNEEAKYASKPKNFHPTVKPVSLMKYLIKLVSREDATILDPFIGSGTTAVACERLNRKWIGIEKEREYYNIAVKRIENIARRKKRMKLFFK